MTAVSWLLLAAAVLITGDGRAERAEPRRNVGAGAVRLPMVAGGAALVAVALFVGGPVGVVAGAVAGLAAGAGVARLQARPGRDPTDAALPLVLDVAAAALVAGHPVDSAVAIAAPLGSARTREQLEQVARLLRLGAPPRDAWRGSGAALVPVAAVACRSAHSGARLAAALTELARELREAAHDRGLAAAQRAGVLAMVPLGLCFLPAFVCLGVVPVVAGLTEGVSGVLP